jgi:glycosyltransferase involved in cell wall biosynthesis
METSSIFEWQPRREARQETGMVGRPVFLWAGRLHPEKDPMTALRGFERIVSKWPDARLYLYYLTDELLPELQRFVESSPHLSRSVHFRGRAPHEQMASIYNSADFFLQASSREAGGIAVLEAMSCGVIPIVTDIPSFRSMTGGGRYGALFPLGEDESLAREVLSISREEVPRHSRLIRDHFQQHLSFSVLACRLDSVYRELTRSTSAQPIPAG